MALPHNSYLCVIFWVNTFDMQWSPVFVAGGRHSGLTGRRERR